MKGYLNHPLAFPLMAIGIIFIVLGVGIHLWFSIDSAMDFSIVNEKFATNQTYVDSFSCEEYIMMRNAAAFLFSPSQQDEVEEMKGNMKRIIQEKDCKV